MATATDPRLESVRSHSVSLEYASGHDVTREECYPELRVTWRGQEIAVTFSCDRYASSAGWTDWRSYVRRTEPDTTDTARSAIREACEPLVRAWLDSDAYRESRQRAFYSMIRAQLRDEKYNADTPAETLARNAHELSEGQRGVLTSAVDALRTFLRLVG